MSEIDESNLDSVGVSSLEYRPRTIKMCVRAIKDINSNQPQKKVIYRETTTIDLALPSPSWKDLSFDSFLGHETKIRFIINVSQENEDFFPLEPKNFLRFDVAVWGHILGGTPEQSLTSSTWIHPDSPYAASKIIMGPLLSVPVHFVFSTVFQTTP